MESQSMVGVDWLGGELQDGRKVSVQEVLSIVGEARTRLAQFDAAQLVDAFQAFSDSLLVRSNPLLTKYPRSGIPFLGQWCGQDNLTNLLGDSLGSLECLDRFVPRSYSGDRCARAFPKGVVIHWMAGNVPTLGLLSLVSGVLTKNANLVKVPTQADSLLADLMCHLGEMGEAARAMAQAVAVIRYDYKDEEAAHDVSLAADARIVWGGDESSTAIKQLPTKLTCQDLVFPDRTSFVVVGSTSLSPEKMETAARLIAHDASVFEQKACASPHTVFVASQESSVLESFCLSLEKAMHGVLKLIPKKVPSQQEVQAVLNLRAQYDMFHEAWYSKGTEFTILNDDLVQLGPPIGNRTIYVRPLPPVEELATILPPNVQSVGISAEGEELEHLTNVLGAAGVYRFTPLGAMTHFEVPWDGLAVPQQLVRWTTRQVSDGAKNGEE